MRDVVKNLTHTPTPWNRFSSSYSSCKAPFLTGFSIAPRKQEDAHFDGSGGDGEDLATIKKRVLMTLFQDTGIAKVPAIARHVKHFIKEEGGKLLIFAHHKEVLKRIEDEVRGDER